MRPSATKRQLELLKILYEYIRDSGYPPTFEEMREALSVSSNQSVIDLLAKLEKRLFIKRNASVARGIAILSLGYEALGRPPLVGLLGVTSAGSPLETIEIAGKWEIVSPEVSKLSDEVFLLKVAGDSMINAGIDDGDAVLVQSKKEFFTGEVVYAQIGDGSTIKRFVSEDKPPYVYLKPENPKYKNILITDDVELKGKIIAVLKNDYWKPVK